MISRVLGALLIALMPLAAAGQTLTAGEVAQRFAGFDTDSDGRISKNEFELNKVIALFQPRERRTARSGSPIERTERQIVVRRGTSQLSPSTFEALDTNGDGALTGAEIIASDQMQFENIDRDRDGFIGRAEFDALVASLFR